MLFFVLMIRRPPRSTLCRYTTLFRSDLEQDAGAKRLAAMDRYHRRAPVGVLEEDMAAAASLDGEAAPPQRARSEEHTSELQSRQYLVCRLLLEKKKTASVGAVSDTLP